MKLLHLISRIVVGITFIFSGVVKGIDPLGTAYRFEDYFLVWGTPWMLPATLTLSILMSTLEFTLGVVVLLNLKPRINSWLLLVVMLFFTGLTLNDAIFDPVPDCGCFGDAIILTNWQTFYKNIILLIFTLILFAYRNKTRDRYGNLVSYGSAVLIVAMFAGFSLWNYNHLPILDFREWKKGNKMYVENPQPVKYYLIYRNKATGEIQEYLSPDYPYNDSVWMQQWEFVEQRLENPNISPGSTLQILDEEGNDFTETFIRHPGCQYIVISWDLEAADTTALKNLNEFALKTEEDGCGFIALTATLPEKVEEIKQQLGLSYEFFYADDIVLKSMVRANPGLMLMDSGIVIDKWHFNDLPAYEEVILTYPPKPAH